MESPDNIPVLSLDNTTEIQEQGPKHVVRHISKSTRILNECRDFFSVRNISNMLEWT